MSNIFPEPIQGLPLADIPKDVLHSGKIYAGYADITFFNEKNRYSAK